MSDADALAWLQSWYAAQCTDEWEEEFGVHIGTIDNPGWSLKVDLARTDLNGLSFDERRHNYEHATDWWVCSVRDNQFIGFGGPLHLTSLIGEFRKWVTSATS